MIHFDRVTFTYPTSPAPVLRDISAHIAEGELALLVGATGSGKTTLLRAINGLVPHFSGGHLAGSVTIDGRRTQDYPPRELADLVGFVPQDPMSGFVTDLVEDELAYSMESLGVDQQTMRRRVEETLDLLGLSDLRNRALRTLSGGQQQRVAIGAVLTAHPKVLVLDEPTSALDPGAAEEVLAALHRLVHDLGVTVVLAEHRLERVVQYADSILLLKDGQLSIANPSSAMADSPIAPPVIHLGRLAGWSPLPISIRDARRCAGPLRNALIDQRPRLRAVPESSPVIATVTDLDVGYGRTPVLSDISLQFNAGEIIALMGRNGAGKSTLLRSLIGLQTPERGTVRLDLAAEGASHSADPSQLNSRELLHHVGLVPQEPSDLFEAQDVAQECRNSDRDAGCAPGTTRALLALMAPAIVDSTHPRDLSDGQQMLLALCIIVAAKPPLLLLDEPTRGLDYPTKAKLVDILRGLAETGHCVVMATHDVELVAELATRVVILGDTEVVADGSTVDVVTGSPMFAPQVAKILAPQPWLTVGQVHDALARSNKLEDL
ncbi:MAG: ATP-binding cassette domain-containing protein [Candidatus Nanopelagicales bacterium]|jgi:energy-coupling factor transport system ATP-binding protein